MEKTMKLKSRFGGAYEVSLEINTYLNNMPELKKFIEENDLGEFTGLMQRSGFCEYPLYMFNVDKLRELCPDGMQAYEASIGKGRDVKVTERAR